MALLEVNELKKEFLGEILFDDVSFSINKGDKLAIIGNNGVGKTTILKMILKQIDIDGGHISVANGKSIGYLSQVMINSFDNTLYQEMLLSFKEVVEMEKNLKELTVELGKNPNDDALLKKYGYLENLFMASDGYNYPFLIDLMISKFGFSKDDYNRKISSFSGGERNKIAFTKLLLSKPDILILDEPTNHLDVNTIEWLEDYLKNYEGSIIIVSHDRYFIDNVCNLILDIANKTSSFYSGNYSFYLEEKVKRYEQQLKEYNLQQKEIEHLQELIKKFKPKPNKVSFAKDREKKLSRILENKIDEPKNSKKNIHLNLKTVDDRRVRQMTISDLTFGYNDKSLIDNQLNFPVYFGDKVAIIGPNGSGKTTLLKTIAGMYEKISGKIVKHRELKIGYIDQNQIQISSTKTVFDYYHDEYPYFSNFEVRRQLGAFLFSSDDVYKCVNNLSGGEKVRLSFAKLVAKKYDMLLLDEPTNHLDMDTRKVLESALIDYPGTIIFVSHDRYFIDELATKIISIENHEITVFKGDYGNFKLSLKNKELNLSDNVENNDDEEHINDSFELLKEIKPKRNKSMSIEKLETKINTLEKEIEELEELMYLEENYTDQRKMDEIDVQKYDKKMELDKIMEEYLEKLDNC